MRSEAVLTFAAIVVFLAAIAVALAMVVAPIVERFAGILS